VVTGFEGSGTKRNLVELLEKFHWGAKNPTVELNGTLPYREFHSSIRSAVEMVGGNKVTKVFACCVSKVLACMHLGN
jgi:hypothetical protein